jgi:phytoene dehydrogenase-like protein
MTPSPEPIRTGVVVVGAGIAGLTAARLLLHAGHEVRVVDGAEPGGRGRSDTRSGSRFNRGPHALYLGGEAERVLASLGVPLGGGPPSAKGAALVHDRMGELPFGPASLMRTKLLGARGKLAVAGLLRRFDRIDASRLGGTTFAEWLGSQELPDDAAALLAMLSRVSTYSHAPEIAAADMVVGMMQRAMRSGVRYLHGGWQSIVDSLAAGLVIEHTGATSVRDDEGHVVVECGNGRRVVAAAAVVAVGTPSAAATLLGRVAFDVGPVVEASCLDLAVSRAADPGLLFGIDEPLYLSDHSVSASLAPAGHHVVHVARYLSPAEQPDPRATHAQLAAHAARAGLDEGVVVDSRYLHRMTVVGALAIAAHGGLRGRPSVGDSGMPRVFLAGDWVGGRGHLLDAVVASAEEAAGRVDRVPAGARLLPR